MFLSLDPGRHVRFFFCFFFLVVSIIVIKCSCFKLFKHYGPLILYACEAVSIGL